MKRCTTTAAIGMADGTDRVIHAGTTYPDDDPAVIEWPALFVDHVDQVDEKPARTRRRSN